MSDAARGSIHAIALVLGAAALGAQVPPLGDEFQVNTTTSGTQRDPKIARLGTGFVVAWTDYNGDGSGVRVAAQIFNARGQKVGGEIQVNTYTTGGQRDPAVASDGQGNFVVVWEDLLTGHDGDGSGVFGQRFDSSGAKVGPEFPVNTYTPSGQFEPTVAMNEKGEFVVVWDSFLQDYDRQGLFGQKFDAAGAKVGPEFPVNSNTLGNQHAPSVGIDRAGRFVVSWSSPDLYDEGVFAQRFSSAGEKIGHELRVNTADFNSQNQSCVAVQPAGDFLVAWTSVSQAGSHFDIYGQRFNISGERVGGEFLVSTETPGYQENPSAAVDPAGAFVVAWDSFPDDRSNYSVVGQRLDRRAQPTGPPLTFSLTNKANLNDLAATGAGPAAVWMHDDGSGSGITARRQDLTPIGLNVDARGGGSTSSDVNGVLEPGESVRVEPLWANFGAGAAILNGSTPLVFCIIGIPCVTASDREADYGTVAGGALAGCDDGSPDACYTVGASGPRPGTHWDGGLAESVAGAAGHSWTLHVGDSFTDVPRSQPFYKKIETMLHHGITTGCGPTTYCPGTPVPRDQMAIFVGKAMAGAADLVPSRGLVGAEAYSCTSAGISLFTDVAPTDSACRHVHYIASQNVTLGCSATQYCPTQTITRDAMASFIAKALVAPGGGNAVPLTYGPDAGTGRAYSCAAASPNVHFTDVPVSNAFCRHIHYLWARAIVDGCTATAYCPSQVVNRDAMAKFISNAFGLTLYRP
ncbi:MAG TPA: S-layer homology domain-containing protein [Thermoanaerobaculia bacterium]